ncbi:MerR family transcriptional regulator [Yoonia sediminilitoris]|uniref:MerR-like DNA binding protein n=1 Tax=Yoonia sediminilitoris TaxID=1286148 RepID=A0A2T6KRN2_9RHOB|nr:MerR family transcriptional regulator [Yoonia sediminilitoris]PUB19218.1 MerR-like DNA binding protein [Yoonia sediminilitoris]RCW99386.1 MerR-like DNA binding protein [Yoonia sediminilitoris]
MAKAKDAFRTISEVAEWLETPTHVLRFWESKFSQIRPVKGAGGRRYYRPADMELLGGIKHLLHEEGMTIKGTQKLLREKGVKHVATLGLTLAVAPDTATAPSAKEPAEPASEAAAPPEPELTTEPVAADPLPEVIPPQAALPFDDPPPPAEPEVPPAPVEPEVAPTAAEAPAEAQDHAQLIAEFLAAFPEPSSEVPAMPARSFGLIFANADTVQQNAKAIAPLVARLETLRDRLRAE